MHVPTAVLVDGTNSEVIQEHFRFNLDAPPVVGDRIGLVVDGTMALYEVVARLHVAEPPNTSGVVAATEMNVTQMILYVESLGNQPIDQP